MVPSEAEIEARLAELRRRREAIDREIADHLLYLELGRRLRTGAAEAGGPEAFGGPGDPGASGPAVPGRGQGWAAPAACPSPVASAPTASAPVGYAPAAARPAAAAPVPQGPESEGPPPVSFDEDPAAARRYGRALIEAAVAVLAEVGRPMHAGEILEHLVARGFTVPGQDPVAALNTRLWKRSVPGGPLRRLGDAVYDRADAAHSA